MAPPASFYVDKGEIVTLLAAKGCNIVSLVNLADSYDQLLSLLFDYSKSFDHDSPHLIALLSTVDDTILVNYGVYLNKTLASVHNPLWIVNSTITDVLIDAGMNYEGLEIHANSTIGTIQIQASTQVRQLVISSGSQVDTLDIEAGSCVELLLIKEGAKNPSKLLKLINGSCVQDLGVDENAEYGGVYCP